LGDSSLNIINERKIMNIEAATSIPTKMLYSGRSPALIRSPTTPFGRKLLKNTLLPNKNPADPIRL